MMLRFGILFLLVCYSRGVMCQKDTLPPPTMTSDKLITLDDYDPDVLYGISYPGMPDVTLQAKTGKTVFSRRGSKFVLPALFIAYGTAARFNQLPVRRWDHDVEREIRRYVNRQYDIDDYFQYGMPVLAYGLDFIPGIDSRHNLRDRTFIMATSLVFMQSTVSILKSATSVARPGNGDHNSFPSGHTAITMLSAHVLYREYRDVTPWIGVCGYLMATTTGVFRILNGAHWQSDVVAGAGIGLLSAEIGYMMLPVWHSILGIDDRKYRFAVLPVVGAQCFGAGAVCRF